jgi:hypothetical protein
VFTDLGEQYTTGLTDIDVVYHRSSRKKNYSIVLDCTVYNLDNSTNIGSKSRDKYPSWGVFDLSFNSFSYDFF